MDEGIIREGNNLEEIIENICREYNIGKDEFELEVLAEGRKGFLGLGAKKAKVRVKFKIAGTDKSVPAQKILEDILRLAAMEARVEARVEEGTLYLNIISNERGLLIGKRGNTLDAIQYLMNKIVAKRLDARLSVVVDSENYRDKRKENLKEMAQRMSEKAKRIGKPISLRTLSAKDRRVVHMALKEEKNIITKSVGKGDNKKLVIFPQDEKPGEKAREK